MYICSVCVSSYFPSILGDTGSVDRKRERLEWLIHIWFSYHTHSCTLQWNQSVWHAFACFGRIQHSPAPGKRRLCHCWEFDSLPKLLSDTVTAVLFPLFCLLETCYYRGMQPACKWAEAENTLAKHVPVHTFWTPIETQLLKAASPVLVSHRESACAVISGIHV